MTAYDERVPDWLRRGGCNGGGAGHGQRLYKGGRLKSADWNDPLLQRTLQNKSIWINK